MNEQIKKLVFEAVDFRLDPDSERYEAQVHPEDLEYLAELIIKECAEIALREDPDPSDCILKHFGVDR